MAQSQSSEVLVSRVVTDLVAGAGLKFSERGSYELKGLPGRWDLFAASLWVRKSKKGSRKQGLEDKQRNFHRPP
jgi:hypothetical protein